MNSSSENGGADVGSGRGGPPSPPRWVKWFGFVSLILLLLFAILHLTGRGMGGHAP